MLFELQDSLIPLFVFHYGLNHYPSTIAWFDAWSASCVEVPSNVALFARIRKVVFHFAISTVKDWNKKLYKHNKK